MMVPVLSNATIDNISAAFRFRDAAAAGAGSSVQTLGNWPSVARRWDMRRQRLDDEGRVHSAPGLLNATFIRLENPLDALANQQEDAIAYTWRAGLFSLTASHGADDLTPTVMGAFRSLMSFGPRAVDLRGLNVHTVNGMHLVAILRSTHSWRGEVPGWREALTVACQALERSELSVEDAAGDLLDQ